jgi:hypothetical protein
MTSNIPDEFRYGDEPDDMRRGPRPPLDHDLNSGTSGFTGRDGMMPALSADRMAIMSATIATHGAALDLSVHVRDRWGKLLSGDELLSAVADWLREQGIDPDTGNSTADGLAGLPVPVTLDTPRAGLLSGPHPPEGLPLGERHQWACRWALTVQARTLAGLAGVTFEGTPAQPPGSAGPGTVLITVAGITVCELANTGYRHSPTGFGWGYTGSGAAALSCSMLTAALGDRAACPACLGSGKVTWLAEGPYPVPWQPGHDDLTGHDEEDSPREVNGTVVNCEACDGDGIGVSPRVYQKFKDTIARLDGDAPFSASSADVLNWLEHQNLSARLAVAAAEVPR